MDDKGPVLGGYEESKDNKKAIASSHCGRRSRIAFVSLAIILIVAGICCAVYFAVMKKDKANAETIVVKTDCGFVQGIKQSGRLGPTSQTQTSTDGNGDVYIFKGIPYGRPPVHSLRWQPPQGLKASNSCWAGVYKAQKYGSQCVQPDLVTLTKHTGSENCLYLNIWSPRIGDTKTTAKLPVLVWIHGGNLVAGSGEVPDGAEFVRSMGVILVGINYRLNAFGFMTLDVLSANSKTKTSGNYGFMDQILALKWVKVNIVAFGGDPEAVTIIGQSSGATSIFGLLASKAASGLFKRVIAMSGSPVFEATAKQASMDNEVFLKNTKCNMTNGHQINHNDTLKCLYGLNQTQILHSIPWFVYPSWAMFSNMDLITKDQFVGALCVVDGDVIFAPPGQLHTLPPLSHNVSVLLGSTAQEIDFLPLHNFKNSPWSEFTKFVNQRLSPFSNKLPNESLTSYNKILKPSTAAQLYYATMASDIRVTCPSAELARNFSKVQNFDVYRYVVTNRPSHAPVWYQNHTSKYSTHLWDLGALFGFTEYPINYKPKQKDLQFMKNLRNEFLHFIKTGKPNNAKWRKYPENIGIFGDAGVSAEKFYNEEQCEIWNKYNLFQYGWKN
eukprot:gene5166-5818_t